MVLAEIIETVSNRVLRLDPDTQSRLRGYAGKTVEVNVSGFNKPLFILFGTENLHIETTYDGDVSTKICGSLASFVSVLAKGADQSMFVNGQLTIEGDTQLAQQLVQIAQKLEIDWEEQVSRFVGDFPARKLGNIARGLKQWSQQTRQSTTRNIGEYFVEESRHLAAASELEYFYKDVDELRGDVARLAQRIEKIKQKLEQITN